MTLETIDALIDQLGLVGRKCEPAYKRTRCECQHMKCIHEQISDDVREPRGNCRGNRGRCECRMFKPYSYQKETDARREKLRAFAFALLRDGKG